MAQSQCIDETFERNISAYRNRRKQISHGGFPKTFHLIELDLDVAHFEREDICWLLDPAVREKQRDLLFAQSLDIEGTARDEMPEVLDLLIGACELAGAARNCTGFAGSGRF